MRILVVNWQDRLNPQAGGAEIHLHEIFGRLARRGHEVTLLVSGFEGGAGLDEVDGMVVHRVGGRMTFGLHARRHFRRRLAQSRYHMVVEDLNKVPLFTPLWSPAPTVLLIHHLFGITAFQEASPPVALATWLLERPIPWVYRKVPVVAVSRSTAEDLRTRGLDPAQMAIVPNGVDLERYRPDPELAPFQEPTVLYLGRLKRYKRVDLLIRAVARIREEGVEARLLIAGRGDHERPLRDLTARLGVQKDVDFLGFVDEARKVELLRRSWIHALTSPKEGWGIANLEAAACGTPTVASDSPGLRDSVLNGRTGRLVPHENLEALTEELRRLLLNRTEREEMGREARRFAEGFSWDGAAEEMERVLETWVAPAQGQP